MVAKSPKRVAAGKKAWRNRRKGKKRGGGRRGKSNRRKPVQRGITGRVGAIILGVIPPVLAGADAVGVTMAKAKHHDLNIGSAFTYGIMRFTNNLTQGFLGKAAFENVKFTRKDGSEVQDPVGAGLPPGSLWLVAGTGILMMVYDAIAAKLAGGRPIKIMGTSYNATGGS